jgi:hypothetical protein
MNMQKWKGIGLFCITLSLAVAQINTWQLKNTAVNESSGVVASTRYQDVFWTHNDSGDGPNVYAFDRDGKDLGTFTLQGVTVRDCEDITIRTLHGKTYLYLGDIGDNRRERQEIVVYRFLEPAPNPNGGTHTITQFETIRLKYPDGAYDCETLMVQPKTGDLYLVTKVQDGQSRVYKLPNPRPLSSVQTLQYVATVPFQGGTPADRLTTGGDIVPDGSKLVIRTYLAAWEFTLPRGQKFDAIFSATPRRVALPIQPQGEAICYTTNAKTWIITSESAPCMVMEIKP